MVSRNDWPSTATSSSSRVSGEKVRRQADGGDCGNSAESEDGKGGIRDCMERRRCTRVDQEKERRLNSTIASQA